MKAFLLKVDSALYIQWTRAAKGSGLNVSEWIRAQCNKRLEIDEICADGERRVKEASEKRDAEGHSAQDLPRVGNVPAPERRAGVAKSVSASRSTRKKEREIKLCRHNLAECTICGMSA